MTRTRALLTLGGLFFVVTAVLAVTVLTGDQNASWRLILGGISGMLVNPIGKVFKRIEHVETGGFEFFYNSFADSN